MEINNAIRAQVMRGESESIRALLLNSEQVKLLRTIGNKEITASVLVEKLDITIQNASNKLSRLYRSGYLYRENTGDPSGGTMYVYCCTLIVLNN